jgi:hypothetical protein
MYTGRTVTVRLSLWYRRTSQGDWNSTRGTVLADTTAVNPAVLAANGFGERRSPGKRGSPYPHPTPEHRVNGWTLRGLFIGHAVNLVRMTGSGSYPDTCSCGYKLVSRVTHKNGRKYPPYVCSRFTRDGREACPDGTWLNVEKLWSTRFNRCSAVFSCKSWRRRLR